MTFDSDSAAAKKVAKGDQKIYAPPSGKFSEKAGTYQGEFLLHMSYLQTMFICHSQSNEKKTFCAGDLYVDKVVCSKYSV